MFGTYIIHIIYFDRIKICYRSSIFCTYYYMLFLYRTDRFSSVSEAVAILQYYTHNAHVRLFINIILYHSPELDKGEQKPHIKIRERFSAASAFVSCKFSFLKKKTHSRMAYTIEKSNIIPVSLKVQNWIILYDTRAFSNSFLRVLQKHYFYIVEPRAVVVLCCLNLILFHILFETTVPFIVLSIGIHIILQYSIYNIIGYVFIG